MMDDYWTHLRGRPKLPPPQLGSDHGGRARDDLFTRWACEYLEERAHAKQPFFLYLAYKRAARADSTPRRLARQSEGPRSAASGTPREVCGAA